MIRAGATAQDGRPLMLFGLTPANLEKLRAGEPIFIDCRELHVDAHLLIVFGETERAVIADLRAHGIDLPDDAEETVREAERVHREKGTQP